MDQLYRKGLDSTLQLDELVIVREYLVLFVDFLLQQLAFLGQQVDLDAHLIDVIFVALTVVPDRLVLPCQLLQLTFQLLQLLEVLDLHLLFEGGVRQVLDFLLQLQNLFDFPGQIVFQGSVFHDFAPQFLFQQTHHARVVLRILLDADVNNLVQILLVSAQVLVGGNALFVFISQVFLHDC